MQQNRSPRHRSIEWLVSLALLLTLCRPIFAGDVDAPNTAESIKQGRALFMTLCTQCHGHDGKAQVDVVANATDLTDPSGYRNGSDNASIARSIRDGAGAAMPAWRAELKDPADIVNLRNFIQSLWPKEQRPRVVN